MIESLKLTVRDTLGVPVWLVILLAGAALFLLANRIAGKPVGSAVGLLWVALAGLGWEGFEIYQHYGDKGLFAAGNDPLWQIAGRHLVDVLTMLILPGLAVVWFRSEPDR